MKQTHIIAAAIALSGSGAIAQNLNDQIVSDLSNQGFGRIEIDNSQGQTRVEAVRGSQEIEVVWDDASGQIVSQESRNVRAVDGASAGGTARTSTRSSVEVSRMDDDEDDDGHSSARGYDDDYERGDDNSSDDHDDDHDDDHGDDHGDDHDDDHGDDHDD